MKIEQEKSNLLKASNNPKLKFTSQRKIASYYTELTQYAQSKDEVVEYMKLSEQFHKEATKTKGLRPSETPSSNKIVKQSPVKSSVTFEDIIGMEEIKEQITKLVLDPLNHPEYYSQFKRAPNPGGGIILSGIPGNGKSFFAEAIAGEIKADFYKSVKFGEMISKYHGDTEKNLTELFSEARKYKKSVIFFDEFDAIASSRESSSDSKTTNRMVNALLQEIDSFKVYEDSVLLLIGATNHPERLDPAIVRPGRFDRIYNLPNPNKEARRTMFEKEFSFMPVDNLDLEELIDKTEGCSFAFLKQVTNDAGRLAVREAISKGISEKDVSIRQEHVNKAIDDLFISEENKN